MLIDPELTPLPKVNAPPPAPVISMLNKLASKTHRSLWSSGIKESMVPLFEEGLQGQKQNDRYVCGARNWCAVDYDERSGALQFDLRVEVEKGMAAQGTKSYKVTTPATQFDIPKEVSPRARTTEREERAETDVKKRERERAELTTLARSTTICCTPRSGAS
jgi:hypothetical protein